MRSVATNRIQFVQRASSARFVGHIFDSSKQVPLPFHRYPIRVRVGAVSLSRLLFSMRKFQKQRKEENRRHILRGRTLSANL